MSMCEAAVEQELLEDLVPCDLDVTGITDINLKVLREQIDNPQLFPKLAAHKLNMPFKFAMVDTDSKHYDWTPDIIRYLKERGLTAVAPDLLVFMWYEMSQRSRSW